jgi:hypothetical protein
MCDLNKKRSNVSQDFKQKRRHIQAGSLPSKYLESKAFMRDYKAALRQLREPVAQWVNKSKGRKDIIKEWRQLTDLQKKALQVGVDQAMSGPVTAYRYSVKGHVPDRSSWGGLSLTTTTKQPEGMLSVKGPESVRAFTLKPDDVLIHWNQYDPAVDGDRYGAGTISNFRYTEEEEVILKPNANPKEIPIENTEAWRKAEDDMKELGLVNKASRPFNEQSSREKGAFRIALSRMKRTSTSESVETFRQRLDEARKQRGNLDMQDVSAIAQDIFNRIGRGGESAVFKVSSDKVLKISNKRSIRGEYIAFADPSYKNVTPDVYEYDEEWVWMVVEKVEPITSWENLKMAFPGLNSLVQKGVVDSFFELAFQDICRRLQSSREDDWFDRLPKREQSFFQSLADLHDDLGLDCIDMSLDNFGIDSKGNVVLIDILTSQTVSM